MKFSDYDVVKTTCSLDDNVPKGTRGAVLMVFESEHSRYEVEFVDFNGDTLTVLTVDEIYLELV